MGQTQVGAGEGFLTNQYPHGLKCLTPELSMSDILQRLGSTLPLVTPLEGASAFVRPASVTYHLDGKQRRWDMVASHPSVAVVLYHRGLDALLLVRQFRPAVYAFHASEAAAEGRPGPPLEAGFTLELCAGLVDKAKSLEQIAREEIMEEVGYDVPVEAIHSLASYNAAIGLNGVRQSMFWAVVDDSMKAAAGGGGLKHDGEAIEVLALPMGDAAGLVADDSIAKSAGMMFGLLWLQQQLAAGAIARA